MRIIFYDSETENGTPCKHYLNLDRIDCFTFSEQDGATLLYAVMGDDVHKLNEKKKIESVSMLMAYFMSLSERSRVNVIDAIDECNKSVKSDKQKRR
jgi:hypothetical protein